MERVIDEAVLTPIPGQRAAGEDIRGLKLWVDLKTARPKPEGPQVNPDWQQANPVRTDWPTYRDLLEKALREVSKDLELGTFLAEASTRVFGFQGARDAIWMLGGLITGFREQGLYPLPVDGDAELQYGKLDWLNEKFSEVLCEIPLTWRPEPGENYPLNYYRESRRVGGMITASEFDEAVASSSTDEYASVLAAIVETREELARFKQIVGEAYGNGALSFTTTDDTLDECKAVVQGILHKRDGQRSGEGAGITATGAPGMESVSFEPGSSTVPSDAAWNQAEQLARSGNVAGALATMTALAAAEPNGRIRFQRKLLLADLCFQTNRKTLATSILQELNEIIETHKLEHWETSQIVGGVWARLVRCYRDKAAGTANEEHEAEFYRKLSRLDPWQALACGEPAKKD
jgi:type VI secretion system ImpA family protein